MTTELDKFKQKVAEAVARSDSTKIAVLGREFFGNPIPAMWYSAAKALVQEVRRTDIETMQELLSNVEALEATVSEMLELAKTYSCTDGTGDPIADSYAAGVNSAAESIYELQLRAVNDQN